MSAQPVAAAEPDFSLRALVRAALEGDETDPHRIAEDLISAMSPSDAWQALASVMPAYVREVIREQRQRAVAPRGGAGVTTSSRWKNVAQLHAAGELTLLRARVFALGEWKFLGDCTRDDVMDIVEQRDAEATANAAAARRYSALRAAMTRREATLVSDLPADVLSEIFDA